ncbi:MAG TPA: peptide chain release factor N(5)-glutamine methyltransferase [Acholeplasmataceae bacterium]|jgi:release factor glutamine methyltransferase|nr:peptide chain release factor N(5)-glutamine methyltransferase [Acholeplasmataceae bacterium]
MTYGNFYQEQARRARELNKEENAVKLLLLGFSGMTATELYINYQKPIPDEVRIKTLEAIEKYLHENIPVQYLLGYTHFFGLKLSVRKGVLIPRPETEELVERVLAEIQGREAPRIIDIGTGSGAIALAIKKHRSDALVTATDISPVALEVARENAGNLGLDISFLESDLFEKVTGKYHVLVSNPPYIGFDEEIDPLVSENEPSLALYAPDGGLGLYKEILCRARDVLFESNLIAFEIPENKGELLLALAKEHFPEGEMEIVNDLNGLPRILLIRNNWRKQ